MPIMPIIVGLATLAVIALAIFLPIILQILIHLDYVFLIIIIGLFGFDASNGLLANYEIHTVFKILIFIAVLAIWYGLQQIRILNIYIFRIVACAFSAYFFIYLISEGLFGMKIANSIDTIWNWTIGIIYFILIMGLRIKNKSLSRREPFHNEAKQEPEFINK